MSLKTYNEHYLEARRALKAAGVEACGLEARLLLAFAAEKTPEEFLRDLRLYPAAGFEQRAGDCMARRLAGEPVAYIVGAWAFMGLELEVNAHVLIPRSDTEVVAKAAIDCLAGISGARVLDLCAGSGCIGLAIAAAVPDCRVLLADVDQKALFVARRNAHKHGFGARVFCVEADALWKPTRQLGAFDLLVSNPPYIPTAELDGLDASVRDFEPHLALDGGEDGLRFYRSIFAYWLPLLNPGGFLALECGEGQAPEIVRLAGETGLRHRLAVQDSRGVERGLIFQA